MLPTAPSAMLAALLVGAGAGALSLAHCAAMCGPLVAFACGAPGGEATGARRAIGWIVGRTSAYVALGAIVGAASESVSTLVVGARSAWLVSIALGVSLLLVAATWLRPAPAAVTLGTAPRQVSAPLRLFHRALASRAAPPVLGACSALLPCGALWAALASAAATGAPLLGAIAMLAFSVVSAPGLVLSGWLAEHVDARGRRLLGAVMVLGAVILLARPFTLGEPGIGVEGASCHAPAAVSLGEAAR